MRILVALEFFPVDLHTLVEFLAILFLPCLACAELAIVRSYFYFLLVLYPVPVLFYKCSCQACYCAMGRLFSASASAYCDDT